MSERMNKRKKLKEMKRLKEERDREQ